ncbi:MAG TPA: MoaD/ThiS family protein [Gemmatimonadales bacterium]
MTLHRVRLFARYAELFGAEQVEVTLPPGSRVGDLISALRVLPGGASLPGDPFVAVNMSQASAGTSLSPHDEIALLPPLAGG